MFFGFRISREKQRTVHRTRFTGAAKAFARRIPLTPDKTKLERRTQSHLYDSSSAHGTHVAFTNRTKYRTNGATEGHREIMRGLSPPIAAPSSPGRRIPQGRTLLAFRSSLPTSRRRLRSIEERHVSATAPATSLIGRPCKGQVDAHRHRHTSQRHTRSPLHPKERVA